MSRLTEAEYSLRSVCVLIRRSLRRDALAKRKAAGKVMDWIVVALHQSYADEKRFREDAITRLQEEKRPPEPIPATFVLSGSAGRTRTYNPSVNSRMLCH